MKDWVADRLGAAIINLNKLEEKLPTVLEEIAAEKANRDEQHHCRSVRDTATGRLCRPTTQKTKNE